MEVYLITNKINGKKYVGCTTKGYLQRFKSHLYRSSRNENKEYLHRAVAKYGEENFQVSLLERCHSAEEMFASEKKWIEHHKSFGSGGYNLTEGGEGKVGCRVPQEVKERLRFLRTGTRHTEEAKRKMSLARQGKSFSEKHKKALSEAQLGSKNHRWGKPMSKEQKQNLQKDNVGEGNPFYGKTHTEETKRLISERNKSRQLGSKNPAARPCLFGGKRFETGKELREQEHISTKKFYKLLEEGTIVYEDQIKASGANG